MIIVYSDPKLRESLEKIQQEFLVTTELRFLQSFSDIVKKMSEENGGLPMGGPPAFGLADLGSYTVSFVVPIVQNLVAALAVIGLVKWCDLFGDKKMVPPKNQWRSLLIPLAMQVQNILFAS